MANETDKKFTWVIKDFSNLKSEKIYSDIFVNGGCKWRLKAFPKGNKTADYFSIYLEVPESKSLPSGWRRHAKFTFTIVNQILETLPQRKETVHWFNVKEPDWGFTSMIPLSKVHAQGSGFLLNGELKIVATIEVLEVVSELVVLEETSPEVPEVVSELVVLEETSPVDVNGFQLSPTQVKSVKLLLERHPENASKLHKKNPLMKSAYMNLVISLIETLCQSPQQITKDEMSDAYATLEFLTNSGFSLDWLKEKLDEVSEKKEKLEACETRVEKLEGELNDLKNKCLDVEALLEKEKVELSAYSAPLSDVEALLKTEKDECS